MKLTLDCYEFNTHKPDYDSVQEKMRELKKMGWRRLEFEKGWVHGDRDGLTPDHVITAKIYGYRKTTKQDVIKHIKELKSFISKTQKALKGTQWIRDKHLKECNKEIKELTEEIKELTEEIQGYQKDIEKLKMDL
jgi:seryl-tRNA synthetase